MSHAPYDIFVFILSAEEFGIVTAGLHLDREVFQLIYCALVIQVFAAVE